MPKQTFKRLTLSLVVKSDESDQVVKELNQCLNLISADHFVSDNGIVESDARRPTSFADWDQGESDA